MKDSIKAAALATPPSAIRVTVWRVYPLGDGCQVEDLVAVYDQEGEAFSQAMADAGKRHPGCYVLACNWRGLAGCVSPGILDN